MSIEVKDYRTSNTLSELKTEALNDKKAQNLAEGKVAKLLTLLFEIKAEVLMNTNIRRCAEVLIKKLVYGLRKRNVMLRQLTKAEALVNTGRQTSTSQD